MFDPSPISSLWRCLSRLGRVLYQSDQYSARRMQSTSIYIYINDGRARFKYEMQVESQNLVSMFKIAGDMWSVSFLICPYPLSLKRTVQKSNDQQTHAYPIVWPCDQFSPWLFLCSLYTVGNTFRRYLILFFSFDTHTHIDHVRSVSVWIISTIKCMSIRL